MAALRLIYNFLCDFLSSAVLLTCIFRASSEDVLFSNSWAVEVRGGSGLADRIATRQGFINKGQVSIAIY